MTPVPHGAWAQLNLERFGLEWVWSRLAGYFRYLRERNLRRDIRSRAVWISEEAASDEFRFLWDEADAEELFAIIRRIPDCLDEADSAWIGVDGEVPAVPFQWYRGPEGGVLREAPFGVTAGDLESYLRPGRLQGATMLAARDAILGCRRSGDVALELVADFDVACPYPLGIHWHFLPEVATRLMSLVWIRALLGWRRVDEAIGDKLLEMVYLHQRFLAGAALSRPRPDGDDLYAVATQLLASLAIPGFPESERWREDAADDFEDLVLELTFPDGVGREQNTAREVRSLEVCLLVLRVAKTWEYALRQDVVDRIEAMARYFMASHAARRPAGISGDPMAGAAFLLPLGGALRSRSLAAVAGVQFDRPDWARVAGMLDPQAALLIGDRDDLARFEDWTSETQVERWLPPEVFPEGGRFFFRSQRTPSLVLGFDGGAQGLEPLGLGSHADALAMTIELEGSPLVVDPGGLPGDDGDGMQAYLRSTGAHSTVRINWEDSAPAGPGGTWRKLTRISDRGYAVNQAGRLVMAQAAHEAYSTGGVRITHRRMIVRESGDTYHLAIEDQILADRETELEFEILFHLDPQVPAIQKQRDLYQVRVGESMLSFRFSSDNAFEVGATQGHTAPLLGWAARDGVKAAPIWVLRVHGKDLTPIVVRTALFPG